MITDPKLIICDEPVSALDVSVQAQILNLLEEMKQRYDLTMLFIAHDLAVVKNVSDRVAVMYLGKLCEIGAPDQLYAQPGPSRTPRRCSPRSRCPTPSSPPDDTRVLGGEIPSNTEPAERLPVPHPLSQGAGRVRRGGAARCATSGPSSTWRATSRSSPASSSSSPARDRGVIARLLTGAVVVGVLLRGFVDLLGREQHDRPQRHETGRADREADGRGGDVVGQLGDDEHVVLAEREVEGLDLPTQFLDHLRHRGPPGASPLLSRPCSPSAV